MIPSYDPAFLPKPLSLDRAPPGLASPLSQPPFHPLQEPRMDRFRIEDADKKAWGRLVKAWIKGKERPLDLKGLVAQCQEFGFTPHVPKHVKGLVFTQNDVNVLLIRLPPRRLVEASEALLETNPDAAYELPAFYAEFFREPPPSPAEKRELHDARIGEYASNSCM